MSNAASRSRTLTTIVLCRMVVPLCFGALAVWQILGGLEALPSWLANFASRFEINPAIVLRVMLALELAGVCVMLLLDRPARGAAVALLAVACFVLVAEIAATRTAPGLGLRVAMLAAAAVMLWLLSSSEPSPGPAPGPAPAPGSAPASGELTAGHSSYPARKATVGQLVCGLTGIGAAVAVAAVVPLKAGPVEVTGKAHLETPLAPPNPPADPLVELVRAVPAGQLPNRVYVNEPETWLLKRVADLDWAAYLPEEVLADMTAEAGGTRFIVFYRPDNEVCLEVFRKHVSRAAPNRAYALRFPPAPQSNTPDPELVRLPCPNCTLVSMPKGPMWFAEAPVLLRVTDGVVTCMARGDAEADFESCVSEGD